MIDHVAYTVASLDQEEQDAFWSLLGFAYLPVPEDDLAYQYEAKQVQRWYCNGSDCDVHIVQNMDETDSWRWGHICIKVESEQFDEARCSDWLERDSGSGRIWLRGPGDIRVEIRQFGEE